MFKIDFDNNIRITAGDSAELVVRQFNKSEYLPRCLRGYRFEFHTPHSRLPWPRFRHEEEYDIGYIKLIVKSVRDGSIVMVKENDEFPNSIFFDREDTIDMNPGLYVYQIEWSYRDPFGDSEDGSEEYQTTAEGYFEIVEKF